MIICLDHIGVVAHTIEEAMGVLDAKLGFPLDASRSPLPDEARNILEGKMGLILDEDRAPLPDGSYFAPEGTHNYFFQVGEGQTQVEVLIPVVPEAGTYKYLQRFGPGLHHWGYGCDSVDEEAARLRAQGLRQIDLGVPNPQPNAAAFFHPKSAGGILTELVPVRRSSS